MQIASIPARFNVPFANAAGGGYITYPLPEPSQVGISDGRASLATGFPPLNFQPVGAGGVPPFGQDMNGILKQISAWSRWSAAGGPVPYDADFSTAIGGYPRNALLSANDFTGFYISTTDDNTANPNTGGANWLPFFPYQQEALLANRTYYVATTGSDSNTGLSALVPWLTLQHAWDYILGHINFNGFTVTVQVADGTYGAGLIAEGGLTGARGAASMVFLGNTGTPANVVISTSDETVIVRNGAQLTLRGFRLTSSGDDTIVVSNAECQFKELEFHTALGAHINVANFGVAQIIGSYSITGNANYHYYATVNGLIGCDLTTTVTLSGTRAFSGFAYCRLSSMLNIRTGVVTFSGSATGFRYLAELLGNIYTSGGGANYFPGNSAGNTVTSGIYN